MITLDEVIKANECCDNGELDSRCEDCPYSGIGACLLERKTDALQYLKELKDILDPLKVKKISHEITCPQCNSVIAILLPESNEPLTWDELRTMEGKPVWIEWTGEPSWGFVDYFTEDFIFFDVPHSYLKFEKKLKGQTWQAYRKERK